MDLMHSSAPGEDWRTYLPHCSICGVRLFNGSAGDGGSYICDECSDPAFAELNRPQEQPARPGPPQCDPDLRITVIEHYEHRCYICGMLHQKHVPLDMHRILPGKRGGEYIFENLIPVCRRCHRRVEGMDRTEIEQLRQRHR
jgi:5-methylcytosine-specific restriction endonuclease McrA